MPSYVAELVAFIDQPDPPKYDLMKVALAHHRFAWVHPFSNGNGRVVRRLNYPMLSEADSSAPNELEQWCTYVLSGIRDELEKVSRLADYGHLQNTVLLPAVAHARERQLITAQEEAVLQITIRAGTGSPCRA